MGRHVDGPELFDPRIDRGARIRMLIEARIDLSDVMADRGANVVLIGAGDRVAATIDAALDHRHRELAVLARGLVVVAGMLAVARRREPSRCDQAAITVRARVEVARSLFTRLPLEVDRWFRSRGGEILGFGADHLRSDLLANRLVGSRRALLGHRLLRGLVDILRA